MSNKICLVCGRDSDKFLCCGCTDHTNIEKLCLELAVYNPNKCTNEIWNDIASRLDSTYKTGTAKGTSVWRSLKEA